MPKFKLICADVIDGLAQLPDNSVHCCITSPPYFQQRDYQTATWDGGDPNCSHQVGRFEYPTSDKQLSNTGSAGHQARDICPKCGAQRVDKQIGLEATPDEYVATIIEVLHHIWRVLRDDATLWLVIGDSYAGAGGMGSFVDNKAKKGMAVIKRYSRAKALPGIKRKDLCLIPQRLSLALQEYGWYMRSIIIWHKRNPMVESVTDRPSCAYEQIFLLTKIAKDYFFDTDAGRQPYAKDTRKDTRMKGSPKYKDAPIIPDGLPHTLAYEGHERWPHPSGRNIRNVWTLVSEPSKLKCYAVFPTKLVEPCILLGTSLAGCCTMCFTPYQRVIDPKTKETLGWKAGCDCGCLNTQPCVVLDPFSGSGTTGVVALTHRRNYIGIDLNAADVETSRKRIEEHNIDGTFQDLSS